MTLLVKLLVLHVSIFKMIITRAHLILLRDQKKNIKNIRINYTDLSFRHQICFFLTCSLKRKEIIFINAIFIAFRRLISEGIPHLITVMC